MTPEQKASFINAQTALMLCEMESMKAANALRARRDEAVAYDEEAFYAVISKYEPVLGHNSMIDFFAD